MPMLWLLLGDLALVSLYLMTQGELDEQRRTLALTALAFAGFALVALAQPTLRSYCKRQRSKETEARRNGAARSSGSS
jgi:hypothetical protein